jgi:glyoxylase-like metal-dependent hydrolase (beta-lactamase superfamily II)
MSGMNMQWARALGAALLTFAGLVGAAPSHAQPAADAGPPFVLRQLAPGVWAAIDRQGRAGANAGFIIGDDGVAVVDSFYRPEAAPALLAEIRKLTPLPIRYVINTHYHIDHVAGDQVFRSAGALVVAQRNVRGWIHTENLKFFGPDPKPEQKALVAALASPEILVDRDLTLYLGSRRLELKAWPGHTGGDLVVVAPDARVEFCGDLLWRRTAPNLIDATVSRWTQTLGAWERAPGAASLTYVPGHGEVATLADAADFKGYLQDVSDTVKAKRAAGLGGDALTKAAVDALAPKYAGWDAFSRGAPREIPLMAAELAGTKRVPVPEAAQ